MSGFGSPCYKYTVAMGFLDRRYRWLWITLVCVLVACAGMVWAEELGSIRGIVQYQGKTIADHRIMLIRFGPNQDVQRTPGQTDAEGRFVFEGLGTGPEFTYVVGIRYNEQLHRSASIVLEPGQLRDAVTVEVGEQAEAAETAPSQVHITNHLMAVVWRQDHLEVREVVEILNPASTPFKGTTAHAEQATNSLHLPLPEGYYQLQHLQGLTTEHVQLQASGLAYTAPLDPGVHRVAYTYALPMPEGVTVVLARRTLPTRVFDVLVEDKQLVAASDLSFQGHAPIESHSFFHFRGTDLAAHSRSWLQVTRLTGSASLIRISSYGLIIGIALCGMLMPFYGVWRRRTSSAPDELFTPEQIEQWRAERFRMLQTIARLDDQREAGSLDEEAYQQRRRAYKTQLLDIVEHLHEAQQYKEASS